MKLIKINSKGQSLVEVTVAMSILTIVLVGVITLAVNATGLMLASRSKAEATAIAQEGLENIKSDKWNKCSGISSPSSVTDVVLNGKVNYNRNVSVTNDSAVFPGALLVTSTVSWSIPGTPGGSINIKKIISQQ